MPRFLQPDGGSRAARNLAAAIPEPLLPVVGTEIEPRDGSRFIAPAPARRGLSLEHKLPLLITLLLVATLGAGLAVAYRQVTTAAVSNATERLAGISAQLSGVVAPSIPQGMVLLTGVAADEALSAYLDTPDPSRAEPAVAALGRLRPRLQPELPAVLLGPDRKPLLWSGEMPAPAGSAAVRPATITPLPDSGVGHFFRIGERGYF